MEPIFLFSALIGGTFLVCQFAMTLLGLSDGDHDLDGGDHFDGAGEADGDLPADGDAHHSSWLFGILSFKTLVAAFTFFGLSGMFMIRTGAEVRDQLLVSIVCGLGALFGVHALMRSFYRLNQNGTMRLGNAVGRIGTVNVSVPASRSGMGRVQLEIQGRLEELAAVTEHDSPIKSGSQVRVTGLLQNNLLEVLPLEIAATASASS